MSASPKPLTIHSGQGDYRVDFPNTLLDLTRELASFSSCMLLIDENVLRIHGSDLHSLTSALPYLEITANEDEKTLAGVTRVLNFLQQQNATKQTVLLAIGGGVVQDIATFSAHLYYRGIRWVYVPTTLLGMSDSCIGAKCGINLNSYKNQLGVFHSPHRVLICLDFLKTLAETEIISGYGEILKLLLTGSAADFRLLCKSVEHDGLLNPQLARLISASLRVKQRVIEEDEYELDLRRILNYGHTFGHALEAVTHHQIPHGKAVAWGIDLVNFLAAERGFLAREEFITIHEFIVKHFAHRLQKSVSAGELIEASRRDKKVSGGKVNLILLRTAGDLRIVPTSFDAQLEREVAQYLEKQDVLSWP